MPRWILHSLPALLLLLAAGCSLRQGTETLQDLPLPASGAPMTPETAKAIAAVRATGGAPTSRRFSSWIFPFYLHGQILGPAGKDSDEVEALRIQWSDIFPIIPLTTPLMVRISQHRYAPDRAEPVSGWRVHWNPFSAGGEAINDPASPLNVDLRLGGFPLLYSYGHVTAANAERRSRLSVDLNTFLYTLGPAVIKWDGTAEVANSRGYVAMPLLLGGLLGGLLWLDSHGRIGEDYRIVHGPFYGTLLYESSLLTVVGPDRDPLPMQTWPPQTREGEDIVGQDQYRGILWGILWRTKREYSTTGTVLNSSHGPLWGLVGVGSEGGEWGPRLLGLTIPMFGGGAD